MSTGSQSAAGVAPTISPDPPTKRTRLAGIDAARGVALFGMMLVHVYRVAFDDSGAPGWMSQVVLGRSAALFAVLAGVGLGLLTGGGRPAGPERASADRRGIAARAAVIAAIGLSLGLIGTDLEIILVQYAMMFFLVLPFTTMRLRRLVVWAVAWTALSPVIALVCHSLLPGAGYGISLDSEPNWASLSDPLTLLADLFLTGAYPVLQWFSFVLFGLVVGRLRLSSLRVQVLLVAGGALLFLGARLVSWLLLGPAGGRAALLESTGEYPPELQDALYFGEAGSAWWWLAVDAPHAGTTPSMADSMGTAAIVLGLCLLVGRLWDKALLPLAGAGAMTLTFYSAHIVVMALITSMSDSYNANVVFWAQVAIALAVGAAFRFARRRGPLEALAHRAGTAARSGPTPLVDRFPNEDRD